MEKKGGGIMNPSVRISEAAKRRGVYHKTGGGSLEIVQCTDITVPGAEGVRGWETESGQNTWAPSRNWWREFVD